MSGDYASLASAIDQAELVAPIDAAELVKLLKDPHWRIRNMYWVSDKDGNAVRFVPWPEQDKFLNEVWYRNVIPKARQRGFSTVVQIMMLDACIFVPNTGAAVIAQDDQTALTIFQKKIKFAWDRLPAAVRGMFPLKYDTKHAMDWQHGSSITVATSTRGTTLQYLHVSEYGKICAKNPDHANEIQEGALPSVDQHGVVVVESTVETPYGNFSDMVKEAQATLETGRKLSPMDYKLHFASWWDADEYETDPDLVVISPKDNAYFHRLEGEIGRDISPRKRAWYVAKRKNDFGGSDEKMWRQYPSTLKEAFTVSSEGLWLSTQIAEARRDGRICAVPLVPSLPVNTFWDLRGNKVVWMHQKVGPWDHWIDFLESSGEPYSAVVRVMKERASERNFVWGKHYLPHDGDTKHDGAEILKTPADMLTDLGLRDIEIVPRILDVEVGIDQLRDDFANYRIDETRCKEGIKHLEGFAKVWNQRMSLFMPAIEKNGHEHAADAIRQKAQMAHNMRGPHGRSRPRRSNKSGMAA
ncbi:hypothetical protein [Allomesorhizobium alhagi]|uniref:Putative terminase large subunit protein n=1 Tax=Mesorhizobium alhagi CCNWXJ12-2 TaxID=1107882 RepID=H0HNJ5_9HYPH|nr:hypothetical protein [Mesorhizobium alhagi]EHK57648.1 putative terminase large subunit protein [Mesorhizobium alhagi CCNWXJ12-2]